MPSITTRKQFVVQLSNCNGQLQDNTYNEMHGLAYKCIILLIKNARKQQTEQNSLGKYFKTAIIPLTAF